MQIVRLSSILVLMAALLLPPGLFRNCCCTRQAVAKAVEQAPVRPCCKAKAAAQLAAKPRGPVSHGLHQQSCRCSSQLTSTAVRISDQQRSSISDETVTDVLPRVGDLYHAGVIPGQEWHSGRDGHDLDPPLRKMLCRWLI